MGRRTLSAATGRVHAARARITLHFMACRGGNVAMLTAIILPLLVLSVGGAIDYVNISTTRMHMQNVADGAALASAREINIAQTNPAVIAESAKAYLSANGGARLVGVDVSAEVDLERRTVTVNMSHVPETYFSTPLTNTRVDVSATVEVIGQLPLCVLGLKQDAARTLHLQDYARLTGEACAVYSNSTSSSGITVDAGGVLDAGMVCSAGGGSGDIKPQLTVDCPHISDPLATPPGARHEHV